LPPGNKKIAPTNRRGFLLSVLWYCFSAILISHQKITFSPFLFCCLLVVDLLFAKKAVGRWLSRFFGFGGLF